jgi:hypothetical protein
MVSRVVEVGVLPVAAATGPTGAECGAAARPPVGGQNARAGARRVLILGVGVFAHAGGVLAAPAPQALLSGFLL